MTGWEVFIDGKLHLVETRASRREESFIATFLACEATLSLAMSLTLESLKELSISEFLVHIRMKIYKEFDSLRARIHDLNKRSDEIEKSQNFVSKK